MVKSCASSGIFQSRTQLAAVSRILTCLSRLPRAEYSGMTVCNKVGRDGRRDEEEKERKKQRGSPKEGGRKPPESE